MWVTHVVAKNKFDGQVTRVNGPPFIPTKLLFRENLQLKPTDSISGHKYLKTDKAIITNPYQNINKLNFIQIVKSGDKRGIA